MEPGDSRPRCAVLGSPIAHSLSPALHEAAYAQLGLDWVYERHEVTEGELAGFVEGLDGRWRGLSLTMPLKEAALACVDDMSDTARVVSAVNTVLLREDGHRYGENTDVPGMVAALRERGIDRVPEVAVLGGGATARSAVAAAAVVADEVSVYVRTPARGESVAAMAAGLGLTCSVRPWSDRREALAVPLVVVTVPAAAVDDLAADVPARPQGILDVAYDPWPTTLAARWSAAGGVVVSGLDLLVHQAVLQVELMTGRSVPVAVLRAAGESVLAARAAAR